MDSILLVIVLIAGFYAYKKYRKYNISSLDDYIDESKLTGVKGPLYLGEKNI